MVQELQKAKKELENAGVELPEKFSTDVKFSTRVIEFDLEPGLLFITNSWLPHSFTKNLNKKKPVRFVHFNVSISYDAQGCCLPPAAEVI